jgi:hypothetical protein
MMDLSFVLLTAGGLLAGGLAVFLAMRSRVPSGDQLRSLRQEITSLQSQLAARTEAHQADVSRLTDEYRKKVSEAEDKAFAEGQQRAMQRMRDFTLHVRPYLKQRAEGTLLWKKTSVEVGSMYQLMVHGVPCFDPIYKPHEMVEELESNKETIEAAKQVAISGMRAFIAAQFGSHSGVITIDETPIIRDDAPTEKPATSSASPSVNRRIVRPNPSTGTSR